MKQELRCHAVLCPSENKARMMSKRLKERLHQALIDFKKEKVWRQNARLSLANAADEQKTMPFRKIMLQAGSSNYRPPLEKGKSAPKLKVIEEVILEEDEEDLQSEDEQQELVTPTAQMVSLLATMAFLLPRNLLENFLSLKLTHPLKKMGSKYLVVKSL